MAGLALTFQNEKHFFRARSGFFKDDSAGQAAQAFDRAELYGQERIRRQQLETALKTRDEFVSRGEP